MLGVRPSKNCQEFAHILGASKAMAKIIWVRLIALIRSSFQREDLPYLQALPFFFGGGRGAKWQSFVKKKQPWEVEKFGTWTSSDFGYLGWISAGRHWHLWEHPVLAQQQKPWKDNSMFLDSNMGYVMIWLKQIYRLESRNMKRLQSNITGSMSCKLTKVCGGETGTSSLNDFMALDTAERLTAVIWAAMNGADGK